jgi:hypothetical protein
MKSSLDYNSHIYCNDNMAFVHIDVNFNDWRRPFEVDVSMSSSLLSYAKRMCSKEALNASELYDFILSLEGMVLLGKDYYNPDSMIIDIIDIFPKSDKYVEQSLISFDKSVEFFPFWIDGEPYFSCRENSSSDSGYCRIFKLKEMKDLYTFNRFVLRCDDSNCYLHSSEKDIRNDIFIGREDIHPSRIEEYCSVWMSQWLRPISIHGNDYVPVSDMNVDTKRDKIVCGYCRKDLSLYRLHDA